jgi:hypothetical protein
MVGDSGKQDLGRCPKGYVVVGEDSWERGRRGENSNTTLDQSCHSLQHAGKMDGGEVTTMTTIQQPGKVGEEYKVMILENPTKKKGQVGGKAQQAKPW